MIYVASASWMLFAALLADYPRLRDHPLSLGLGMGALLGALLLAVPALGTALGTALAAGLPAGGDLLRELALAQAAWLLAAATGLAGYTASRAARRLRGLRAPALEVVGLGAAGALVPATAHHLGALLVLVPAATAGVAATVLESIPRPAAVLSCLLATATFALVFALSRSLPGLATAWLLLGTAALAYAVGRWSDLHPAAARRPQPLLWAGLAGGFLLVYKLT